MFLHANHDVLKIQRRDVAGSIWIFTLECFHRMLFVEVVQQLRELGIVDDAFFFLNRSKY